jgi:hypothetical protein
VVKEVKHTDKLGRKGSFNGIYDIYKFEFWALGPCYVVLRVKVDNDIEIIFVYRQ